jgi:hypothetical protein
VRRSADGSLRRRRKRDEHEGPAYRWLVRAVARPQRGIVLRKTKRSNETHASMTYKDARLFKKNVGQESCLGYLGHPLVEDPHGLSAASRLAASGVSSAQ